MRALIVFNPLLAGLGLFWFLRKESLSRPVATVGGLCLGMLMSTSDMAIGMPFAGFLGWTTIVLVGASGYRHADRWSRRLAWLALSAFAWSQVASAHMSHGLVMCSLLLAAFLIATSVASVRSGEVAGWTAAGRTGLFLVAMPLASLAILIPRLAFIGSSSLHRGYDALGQPVRSTAHITDRPLATNGVWATWPLAFGSAPGAYVGAVMLLAVLFAWRDRARRALVVAFGGCLVAHVAPHAERDRHGGLVPDAAAQGAVRRRLPPQPRAHALPVDDRDPGPGRGRAAGPARPSR